MSHPARALPLGDRLEVEAAVETAFEPLRARRSSVGPTRVRAAVRWGRVEPAMPVPWAAAVRRISELGVAVGMSAFVFTASVISTPPVGEPIPVSEAVVVDDMLRAPIAEVLQWRPRVIPPIREIDMTVIWRLKRGGQVTIEDRIDATVLPRTESRPEPLTAQLPFIPTPFVR